MLFPPSQGGYDKQGKIQYLHKEFFIWIGISVPVPVIIEKV